jgi:hypothetical protein
MPKNAQTLPKAVSNEPPQADFHVPEVNTDFADNLFQDQSFVDRFDASFSQTVPMGITSETREPAKASKDDWNMLEFDLPVKPKA